LFGRVMEDVGFTQKASARSSKNNPSQEVLQGSRAGDRLARIYAFAYEGHYYDLASPAIFVVHGGGAKPPNSVDQLGVAARSDKFADDIMVWEYDKTDMSVRLNIESGMLEQILLEPELDSNRLKLQFSGQRARLRGGDGDR